MAMRAPTSIRKADRRTEASDLRMELHALRAEHAAQMAQLRAELVALQNLLSYAFGIDGWHLVLGVRDRLTNLVTRLERRGGAA